MKGRTKAGTSKPSAANRRKLFVDAYIANGENGKQAAIEVGFSPKTAEVQASQLLRELKVRQLLQFRREALAKAFELKSSTVIFQVAALAQTTAYDYLTEKQRKQLPKLTAAQKAALGSIEFDSKGRLRRLKLWDKNSALEKAMRHLGLFKKDNDQAGAAIGKAFVVPSKMAERK